MWTVTFIARYILSLDIVYRHASLALHGLFVLISTAIKPEPTA